MFLIVYADHPAPGVPVDLVNGPFTVGVSVIVQTADGSRHSATVEQVDGGASAVVEIADERWCLQRRPGPYAVVQTSGTPVETEYWTIAGPALPPSEKPGGPV